MELNSIKKILKLFNLKLLITSFSKSQATLKLFRIKHSNYEEKDDNHYIIEKIKKRRN